MFLPAIDSLRVTLARIIKNKSPFDPDKNHFHHLLIDKFDKNIVFLPYTALSVIPFALSIYLNTIIVFISSLIGYFVIYLLIKR